MASFVRQCSSGSRAGNFILILEAFYSTQDVTTNATNVGYNLYLAGGNYGGNGYNPYGYSFYGYTCNGSITVRNSRTGGQVASTSGSSNGTVSNSNAIRIASGSQWIEHNADGTLTLDFTGTMSGGYSAYVTGGTISGSLTIPTIPRATTAPKFSVDVEKSVNISLNPASSGFKHSIRLAFGSNTKWLNATGGLSSSEVKLSSKSPLFNCPKEYYSQFTGSKKTGTMTLFTYSGSTQIGYKKSTFTIYANSTICKPVLAGTIVDSNETTKALTGDENNIIKGYSNGLITFTTKRASSKNDSNATVKSITIGSKTVSASATSYTYSKLTTTSLTAKITNSRGFSASYTIKASGSLINYIPLTFNGNFFRTQPTTGEIETDSNGNYFNNTFGSVQNELTMSLSYREKNTNDWLPLEINTPTIENNTYKLNQSLGSIFNYQKQYEFKTNVSDKLVALENIILVTEGIPIFWWDSSKVQIEKELYIKDKSILEYLYPVGSKYISKENSNPSKIFGGTWKLVDKEFKSDMLSGLKYFDANSTNATTTSVYVTRSGHTLSIRLGLTNNVAFRDSALNLGTLNLKELGVSRLHFTNFYIPLYSDAGNGLVFGYFDWETGEYYTSDVIAKSGATIPADNQFYGTINITIPFDYMLDNSCDKFYWERTA